MGAQESNSLSSTHNKTSKNKNNLQQPYSQIISPQKDIWELHVSEIVFVTGPPGPRNQRAPSPIPCPAPVHGPGRAVFFLPSAPAPVRAPAPFKAPDSPP